MTDATFECKNFRWKLLRLLAFWHFSADIVWKIRHICSSLFSYDLLKTSTSSLVDVEVTATFYNVHALVRGGKCGYLCALLVHHSRISDKKSEVAPVEGLQSGRWLHELRRPTPMSWWTEVGVQPWCVERDCETASDLERPADSHRSAGGEWLRSRPGCFDIGSGHRRCAPVSAEGSRAAGTPTISTDSLSQYLQRATLSQKPEPFCTTRLTTFSHNMRKTLQWFTHTDKWNDNR